MNDFIKKNFPKQTNLNSLYNNNNTKNINKTIFLEKKRRLHPLSSFHKLSEESQYNNFIQKSYDFKGLDKEKNFIPQINNKTNLFEGSNRINILNDDKKININNNNLIYSKVPENNFFELLNENKDKIKNNNNNLGSFVNKKIKNLDNITENKIPNLNQNKIEINNEIMNNNNNSLIPKQYKHNAFNIIKNENKNPKKNIFKITNIDDENDNNTNNNEIRVLKNNKIVYLNSSLLDSSYSYKNLKFVDKEYKPNKSKRSSKYRGVSKNGNQWQVLIMLGQDKSYIKSYSSEYIAGRIYDILAIKRRGYKARTNFSYDNEQINRIIKMDIDIKANNINEIISNLFK